MQGSGKIRNRNWHWVKTTASLIAHYRNRQQIEWSHCQINARVCAWTLWTCAQSASTIPPCSRCTATCCDVVSIVLHYIVMPSSVYFTFKARQVPNLTRVLYTSNSLGPGKPVFSFFVSQRAESFRLCIVDTVARTVPLGALCSVTTGLVLSSWRQKKLLKNVYMNTLFWDNHDLDHLTQRRVLYFPLVAEPQTVPAVKGAVSLCA